MRAPDAAATGGEHALVSGGFYIVELVARPPGLGDELLPERMLTLSACLAAFLPEAWALEWCGASPEERAAGAARLGIAEQHVPDVVAAMTEEFANGTLGWPNVWMDVSAARAAARRFGLSADRVALIELGVPASSVAGLEVALAPGPSEGEPGLRAWLARGAPTRDDGVPLGWELLGAERGGSLHSWLCNYLHVDASSRLGVRPAALGLLGSEADALAVEALIAADGRAEPVPWFRAQLRRHPF